MALGSGGGSGGSSSSSNLSALAPPFTVDRFNPKPNSNPILMTDMPYTATGAAAAAPFGHTWQYIQQPETRPDVFPKPQLGFDDSTRTTYTPLINELAYTVSESANPSSTQWSGLDPGVNMPLSNDYRYSVSESVNPSNPQWSGIDFGCNWEYRSPHPLEPRPNVLPRHFDVDDSKRTTSIPLAGDYGCLVSESLNLSGIQWSGLNPDTKSSSNGFYTAEGKPYFPTYASSVVGKDSLLVSPNESGCDQFSASGLGDACSQFENANRLSGLEYVPQWGGVWNGLAEAKHGKQVESRECFSSDKVNDVVPLVYNNYMSQGVAVESGVSTRDPGKLYGKPTDGIQRESHPGSFSVKNGDNKSFFAQELGSGNFYGKSADSIGKEGCTGSYGMGNVNDEFNAQKLGFLPFESSGTQFLGSSSPFSESPMPDPLQESSKNIFNHQKKYGPHETLIQPLDPVMQDSAPSMKPSCAVVVRAPVSGITSTAKDPVTHKAVSFGNVTNVCRKLLDSSKSSKIEESHITSPESMEGSFNPKLDSGRELSIMAQNGDSIATASKRGPGSHLTDKNLSFGLSLSLDHVQAFKRTENPSDALDNHNPAVDSPCWKGAPGSHYSSLDVVKASPPNHLSENQEGSCELDANGNHITPKGKDSTTAASQIPSEGNPQEKIGCTGNDKASSPNSTFDSNFAAKGCRSADGGINFNYSPEDGVIAYHAAEDVLHSPSGEKYAVERHQRCGREATVKMDVPTLINAIRNLAELLRFNCLTDSCGLKEHDQEVLKHVISNLNACISEKITISTPARASMLSQQDVSVKTGELDDLHVGQCADLCQQRHQGSVKSFGQCDHEYMHTEKINCRESDKKADNTPHTLPLVDHVCNSSDENIVQAIKKVLDENFSYEEEMQSQSLLFKNLWLEAEAKLCSISYRARFDHMRIQLDKYKSNRLRGDAGKASGCGDSLDQKATSIPTSQAKEWSTLEGTVTNHSTFSTRQCQKALSLITDDIDASVLTRFNMLKCRDDNSNPKDWQHTFVVDTRKSEGQFESSTGGFHPEGTITNRSSFRNSHADDVEASVLARLNILRQQDEIASTEEQQQPEMVNTVKAGQVGSSIGVFDPEGTINNQSASRNSHAGDVEASVLARFNMLRRRDDKSNPEEQQELDMIDTKGAEGQFGSSIGGFHPEGTITNHCTFSKNSNADDVESSVLARFNILKSRDNKSNTEGQQQSDTVDTKKAGGLYESYTSFSGYEAIKDSCLSVRNDPVTQPDGSGNSGYQLLPGWSGNSSSDWEHVGKDDFSWPKW